MDIKTITLNGSEASVAFAGDNCDIRNDGTELMYASSAANIIPGANGVVPIPAGTAVKFFGCKKKVYLLGTGSAICVGNDYNESVFKNAAAAGGAGEDSAARAAIAVHSANSDIHHTTNDFAEIAGNKNLLVNPWFKNPVNQRQVTGVITSPGFFIDCWELVSGSVELTNLGIVLNGTIKQTLEHAPAAECTASADNGDASYDSSSKTFYLTANNQLIEWAKLECGNKATLFSAPGFVEELVKCKYYYQCFDVGEIRMIGSGSSTRAYAILPLTSPIREGFTLRRKDNGESPEFVGICNGSLIQGISLTLAKATPQGILFIFNGSFTANQPLIFWAADSGIEIESVIN